MENNCGFLSTPLGDGSLASAILEKNPKKSAVFCEMNGERVLYVPEGPNSLKLPDGVIWSGSCFVDRISKRKYSLRVKSS